MTAVIPAWLGTALQLIGALALATRILVPTRCYAVMLPGAVLLLGVALWRQDWPQVCLMAAFTGINSWGLARWRA